MSTTGAAGTERLGQMLDALAVLDEMQSRLKTHVQQFLIDHPKLTRGSEKLTLDDRVANTLSNRREIRDRWGDGRQIIDPPEQLIIAGVAVAAGADQWSVLGHVATNTMETTHTTAGQYRDQLNTTLGPAASSRAITDLFDMIQARQPGLLGDLIYKPPQSKPPQAEGKSR